MTVQTQTSFFAYVGDGVTTVFPFPSKFMKNADLVVALNGVVQAAGYTVTGAKLVGGGSVTFTVAPAATVAVAILRNPTPDQLTSFVNSQTLLGPSMEDALDRITGVTQYLTRALSKVLRIAPDYDSTTATQIPLAAGRANKYLAFDATGQPIVTTSPVVQSYNPATAAPGDINFNGFGGVNARDAIVDNELATRGQKYIATSTTFARSIADRSADFVMLENWGGGFGNSVTDTAAWAAAIATDKPILLLAKDYFYNGAGPITITKGLYGSPGVPGAGPISRILNVATVNSVIKVTNNKTVLKDFYVHGSWAGHPASAKYGVDLANANGTICFNVTSENNRIDGFKFSDVGGENNNGINIIACRSRFNGTIRSFNYAPTYPVATCYRPANVNSYSVSGTIGTNTLTLNTPWDNTIYEIDNKRTVIYIGLQAYVVTGTTTTTISVSPALRTNVVAAAFALMTGSGICAPWHSDNNSSTFIGNFCYGNAVAGLWDQGASASTSSGNLYEWNGIANIMIGHPSNFVKSHGFASNGDYTEQSHSEVWAVYCEDARFVAPKFSANAATRVDAIATASGRTWWQLVIIDNFSTIKNFSDGILLDFRQITNALNFTLDAKYTTWRQGSGVGNFNVVLPDAPLNATQPETYRVMIGDAAGQIATFKTNAAGTLATIRGSNQLVTAFWESTFATWIINRTPALLTGSATYDPPSIAAGGAAALTTVAVTGAALGDMVSVSFSLDLQGLILSAYVSAVGVVSVRLQNPTAGVIDLASGTLTAIVSDVT